MRRLLPTLMIAAIAAMSLATMPVTATAAGSRSGPPLLASAAALAKSLACTPNVTTSRRETALLVHGTGATPAEDFARNLALYLPRAGYPICQVTIPGRELNDLQGNVEYVVWAIRQIAARSHRKVDVIGHSQGAFLATYALRFWPDLATKVDDLIGYAGTYTYGTDLAAELCTVGCTAAFQQFRPGSKFLRAIATRPLPAGPSYTAYTTALDEIVTPQPKPGILSAPGARNYRLQNICPTDVAEHLLIVGEKPLLALTLDALSHTGPANLARIPRITCGLMPEMASVNEGAEVASFLLGVAGGTVGRLTFSEPPLRCYLRATCA